MVVRRPAVTDTVVRGWSVARGGLLLVGGHMGLVKQGVHTVKQCISVIGTGNGCQEADCN